MMGGYNNRFPNVVVQSAANQKWMLSQFIRCKSSICGKMASHPLFSGSWQIWEMDSWTWHSSTLVLLIGGTSGQSNNPFLLAWLFPPFIPPLHVKCVFGLHSFELHLNFLYFAIWGASEEMFVLLTHLLAQRNGLQQSLQTVELEEYHHRLLPTANLFMKEIPLGDTGKTQASLSLSPFIPFPICWIFPISLLDFL